MFTLLFLFGLWFILLLFGFLLGGGLSEMRGELSAGLSLGEAASAHSDMIMNGDESITISAYFISHPIFLWSLLGLV